MLAKVLVKTDLEIQLFFSETTMTDRKIFVDELNGEDRLWRMEWRCFLDARCTILVHGKMEENMKPNQPCVGTLADGFRDYSEGQLAREWGQLRVRYHGG